MILGCDGAGRLDDGTEVVIYPVVTSPDWRGDETLDPARSILTERHQGTFATSVVVPSRNVVPKPAELTDGQAACMGTAWLTAYRMLFVRSGLRPGQTMLVQGASGGVASALVILGTAGGLRVWVTGRTEEKRAAAEALGAERSFEPGARLPSRVDGVFETVGHASWSHSMRSLKPGGVVVIAGATTGDAGSAELQRIFFQQLRVVGSTMGTRAELSDLLSFCVARGIRPHIGTELPLSRARTGFEMMLGEQQTGKIVFTVP
jgi:NADPH:quinone reductase-like Zn-dependent oxidoreductase